MTLAPWSASIIPAIGPEIPHVSSSTRMPVKAPAISASLSLA